MGECVTVLLEICGITYTTEELVFSHCYALPFGILVPISNLETQNSVGWNGTDLTFT